MSSSISESGAEIGLLVILAAGFLAIAIARPFIKRMRLVTGIVWLPPLAFAILALMFAAYGFRPEALPLLVFALIYTIAILPRLVGIIFGARDDGFLRGSVIFPLVLTALLAVSTTLALAFLPTANAALATERVDTITLPADGTLTLRIYHGNAESPVILAGPPQAGGAAAVDMLCDGLRGEGWNVITWSDAGFDIPALNARGKSVRPGVGVILSWVNVYVNGQRRVKAAAVGALAQKRRERAITVIVDALSKGEVAGIGPDASLIIAGWGFSADAAVSLAADSAFIQANANVKGIVAIEPRFYSLMAGVPRRKHSEDGNIFARLWAKAGNFLAVLVPEKVASVASPSPAAVPVLRLSSAPAPDGLATFPDGWSFGPVDLSDTPSKYPLLSTVLRPPNKAPPPSLQAVISAISLFALEAADR
jgi:hypothetical protein